MDRLDSYHFEILCTTANGIYSITELVRTLNRSPNTIVKKANELYDRGFLERLNVVKNGGGKIPKVLLPSVSGKRLLELLAAGEFISLRKYYGVLAGPMLTFSRLGIVFFGRRDLFVQKRVETPFYDVIVCDAYIFEDKVRSDDGLVCPGIESFIVWIIESKNPRFIATVPLILGEISDIDFDHLKYLAVRREAINRLNLLLDIAGFEHHADLSLQLPGEMEAMVDTVTAVDENKSKIGRKYGVTNIPGRQLFEDMAELYGGKLQW